VAKLVLIDGSSYLFRAFHALPPLTNRAGEPTGAMYGVVSMLRLILKQNPDRLAFVLDAPGKTFRHDMYSGYKANRPPTPPDLKAQLEPLIEIVTALGVPILRVPEVEADDVIGTLALAAHRAGMEVEISTSDKDFAQLVRPGIELVNTMTQSRLDERGVREKFGVAPGQVIDYLALMGDSIDNIPGVDKCGPKTAAKWIEQYGSLDGVIANAASVGGKIGENLRAALPQLPLSYQLATIRTDLPLELTPEQLALGARDVAKLRELYTRYEFQNPLKELDAASAADMAPRADAPGQPAAAPAPAPTRPSSFDRSRYELVVEPAQLEHWLERLRSAPLIAFDTETDSLDPQRAALIGMSFAVAPNEAAYIPFGHDYPGAPAQLERTATLAALKRVLEDPAIAKVGQHGKYDLHVLSRHGVEVAGYRHDTMLESYVLNATALRHDMDSLAARYLGHQTIAYEDVAGKGAKQIPFAHVALDDACTYAAEDADVTLRLHEVLYPELRATPSLQRIYEDIEMPLVPVLQRMERRGMLVDRAFLAEHTHQMKLRMHQLVRAAHDLAGHAFVLDSPKQLAQVLFQEQGLPTKRRTRTGQASTDEDVLEELAAQHALPKTVLEYRTLAKLVGTYTESLPAQINPESGRVHTSFHQAVAATGRLSSSDPNLQNIPIRTEEGRRIRKAFIAPPGWRIVAADYSQIELRIMAHFARDPGLLRAFHEGQDIHRATAAEVFGLQPDEVDANQRRAAKAINFGLMYGMGAQGLARNLGIAQAEAKQHMERYFSRFAGVREFMQRTREQAHQQGYVETLFGRRLYLREINSTNQGLRAGAERAAINAPMQGTAADIIKRAMIEVDAWLRNQGERAAMILQVHDELVLEVREDAVKEIANGLRERMSGAAELAVPLEVDVGEGLNWDEAH
jgi:DNA polymerase-1